MDTSRLKKFAQFARRSLIEQVQTKLKLVLAEDSLARRESPKAVKELENKKQELGEEQLLEQVAYTWFNRFCALRFMDVNQYNRIMVVSPVAGQFQPEILAEAKAGHLDDGIFNEKARDEINGLLSGAIPSRDGQSEAYRLMIVAVCNDYHRLMPYLFERIEDYTELLMPDDLLSGNSILAYTREAMTPENCASVESIGWLYQFYISEKKDQVFEGLKKNKKITPENIPAATQLFTPHWIVRYLVENSLGRLWMLNNPSSKVIEQMDYYIKPVEEEKDYLKISSPEELKICDPACGSGHMLTYAYDLLYAIYLDAGYDDSVIPEKILSNNLYGIEIDERAAELAAFALSMKALKGNPLDDSNNRRRFFRNPIEPNICHIQNVSFSDVELDEYFEFVGVDLFTKDLRVTLNEFEEADNFGSLIQPTLKNPADVLAMLNSKDVSGQLFLADTHKSVLKVLKQADYLSSKYHIAIANPPYMGSKGMNPRLSKWAKDHYSESRADLFAMFMERDLSLIVPKGFSAMINMQSWMFLSSFELLRHKLLNSSTIVSMAHLGTRAFDSIGGEVVSTTAFVIENASKPEVAYPFLKAVSGGSEKEKKALLLNREKGNLFFASANDFKKLPGNPIAYWVSQKVIDIFSNSDALSGISSVGKGLDTGNNERFLRFWWEVSKDSNKWLPCQKGGAFRKWYGNNHYVINWLNDGEELKKFEGSNLRNAHNYKKSGLSWSRISSNVAFRYFPTGHIFESTGPCVFVEKLPIYSVCGFLNSKLAESFLKFIAPTLDFQSGHVSSLPVKAIDWNQSSLIDPPRKCIDLSKEDWDSVETSPDFSIFALLSGQCKEVFLHQQFNLLYEESLLKTQKFKELEELNNRNFIEAYGLTDELDAGVDLSNVSLVSNPSFRYGDVNEDELEKLFQRDSIVDLLSYAVGCIFGRYSLDKEGLILANQGDTIDTYLEHIPQSSFLPDQDNVIPLIDFDGDWFEDDISERFKQFLKVAFGEEHFSENLGFIEEAIGKDIKKYFVKDFYDDHVKRYKKRPIYWMFSSTKGTFNALIYIHRYTKDTVDVVLNNYLREFRTKLVARKESLEQIEISASASQKDKTQAIKAVAKINRVLDEINEYEHDVLYPLAGEKVEIDLDDGVKHNYPLFGKALKKVPGLS
ncbi:BREX-1 system adenine-specific DNA-methyltransferase PglX [Vibrio cholerae]|uniref:BREX-1 system adenine-specific DNA-methyltransferase PglX n=1 Tax=Vibrio cholerae TaxID=666 RepID=UPI003015AE88|nr:BREX-1 system adenine-specific DNA-methyltransferase PglX [Vibrio cholerae]